MGFGLFSKGNMGLKLDKFTFAHGETITGTITLQLKKATQARGVFVTIFAETTSTRMTPNGLQRYTAKTFDFSVPLDGEKEYGTMPYNYEFKILVPATDNAKQPDGAMGYAVDAIKFISTGAQSTKWYLEAKLDIPKGFDLSKKVQINIA